MRIASVETDLGTYSIHCMPEENIPLYGGRQQWWLYLNGREIAESFEGPLGLAQSVPLHRRIVQNYRNDMIRNGFYWF
jgi:hypothetical protein